MAYNRVYVEVPVNRTGLNARLTVKPKSSSYSVLSEGILEIDVPCIPVCLIKMVAEISLLWN